MADTDKSKTVIALTNKMTGNSFYSTSLLNKEKPRNIHKVKRLKRKFVNNLFIQIRLHILKFFYFFLKKYILDRHFELLETDTDFIYFSTCKECLDDCVLPHLKKNYFKEKVKWLTSEACPEHEKAYLQCKIQGNEWNTRTSCAVLKS